MEGLSGGGGVVLKRWDSAQTSAPASPSPTLANIKFRFILEGFGGPGEGAQDGELQAVVAGFFEGGFDLFVVGVAEEVGEEVVLEVAFPAGAGANVGKAGFTPCSTLHARL